MSCDEELPQAVGQLRSKAYEFWKGRESRCNNGSRESPERNFSIKPKPPTAKKPPPQERPPRPTFAPSKIGSTSQVAQEQKHIGKVDELATNVVAAISEGEISGVSPTPSSFNQRREIKSATMDSSNSKRDVLSNKSKSLECSSYSDASSYVPRGNKANKKVERASSEKTTEHRKVKKTSSSPVKVSEPKVERQSLSSSWRSSTGSSDKYSGIIRSKKFIPRIETIRASTGDRFSKDDLDLLRVEKSGRVQGLAEELNAAFSGPQRAQHHEEQKNLLLPPSHSQRHASVGEKDLSGSAVRKWEEGVV